ncbi:MAG: ATP-binding protein, partial [Chloroflexi bacterium]|nr:ATP-binding protein [Chloroflexota bacterium]
MEPEELRQIINNGEDSKNEFKSNITKGISLAKEMIAFSNKKGGNIYIGITDEGEIEGLTQDDVRRLNQLIPNSVTDHIRPPIIVDTQNLNFENGLVMVVSVPEGSNKPYMDNNSSIYIRNGASTQKLQTREEIQRIFQSAGLIHADGIPVKGSTMADINTEIFESFFVKEFGDKLSGQDISFPQILENMKLAKKGEINYSGILLFGLYPQRWLPVFNV